ncbi:MAG: RIP metalloprotease RseP [Cytophagales bacterium]|nr:RIP metalloprotease RseP [Cytophagales bacterium]
MNIMSIQYLQLFLSLSFLVILHELGHFIPAKLFKVRVDKFYLFFDPFFSVVKKKIGETEYGIGWLPLGGYVKLSGMIDESMDTEYQKQEPQEWELRSKPAWQRLIIMMGGIIVNIIVAVILYGAILFTWGEKSLPIENIKYGIASDSVNAKLGLQDGDKIIGYDDKDFHDFFNVPIVLLMEQPNELRIDRNGKEVRVPVTKTFLKTMVQNGGKNYFRLRMPFVVDSLVEGSGAKKANLQKGDKIVGVNGDSLFFYHEIVKVIKANKGKTLPFSILRNGEVLKQPVAISPEGRIGVYAGMDVKFATTTYGFFESFPAGIAKAFQSLVYNVKQFKLIFDPEIEGYKQVQSVVGMAKAFPTFWNWQAFWSITAFISIALAFMNFLPIPGLDGGHVMFIMYEMIAGRKPSEKFMETAMKVGMLILMTLMIFLMGRDTLALIFG